jgi:glyoxylase-like metal-dependent hydrolase (beta-lactamase superfamily II)
MLVALIVLALAGYGWYRDRETAVFPRARVPRLARSPIMIAPGIYLLGGLVPSAAYVLETQDGLVLVDAGLDSQARQLRAQMGELGLDWRRVRAIFLTHVHGDHSGGAAWLRAKTGAKVYAGDGDVSVLQAGQPREAFFSTFHMPDQTPHATVVDVALKGGELLSFGDLRIRCLATPGHTPGSICYLLERKNLRALFAGDVIMMMRGDRVPQGELGKPLGTYSAYLAPRYRGDVHASLASLRMLRTLPVPDFVLPGHPRADHGAQSPCISQNRWEELLDAGIRDMETLLAHYEADGADFLDGIPMPLLPDLYYLGDFQGTATYGFFASSKFFLVDPLGGAGLAEFVRTRLRLLGREPAAPTAVLLTSCEGNVTDGLRELLEKGRPQVVAPAAGLETVQASCPAGTVLVASDELPGKGWFPVSTTVLQGRGPDSVAYRLTIAGKTVLFSGRFLQKMNDDTRALLGSELTSARGDIRRYFGSLTQLHDLRPDLWLPANPVDGQNANLYAGEWTRAIEENLEVLTRIVSGARR